MLVLDPGRIDEASRRRTVSGSRSSPSSPSAPPWPRSASWASSSTAGRLERRRDLFRAGGLVWLNVIIAFGFAYWELDGGGPGRRVRLSHPDFQFAQDANPALAPRAGARTSSTTSTCRSAPPCASGPADTLPLARWAKLTWPSSRCPRCSSSASCSPEGEHPLLSSRRAPGRSTAALARQRRGRPGRRRATAEVEAPRPWRRPSASAVRRPRHRRPACGRRPDGRQRPPGPAVRPCGTTLPGPSPRWPRWPDRSPLPSPSSSRAGPRTRRREAARPEPGQEHHAVLVEPGAHQGDGHRDHAHDGEGWRARRAPPSRRSRRSPPARGGP